MEEESKIDVESNNNLVEEKLTVENWKCIIGMFIVHFFYGGLLKSLSIMYSPWQATFNVNNAEVAVIFSALATCMQCGAFTSKFLQSYGQKVLFASSIIAFLGAFTAYLAKTLTTLAIGIGILGFSLGIFRVRSISILSQNVIGGKRAIAISLGMVGTAVGATVLPLLWRFILYRYSTGQAMLILAGMLLNLFIAALCLKEKSQTKEEKKNSEPDSIREIFNLPVILYCIAMLLNFSGKTAQFPFFVPYAESIGLSGYEPATIVLLINVVDIFSRPVGGQIGSSKAVQKIGGSILPIIFFILMALMNALALFTITDFLSYSIWAAIYGVVYAIPVPATMSCICEFTHVKNMNNVLSINAMVAIGGMFTFPILNGMLIDHFGDFGVTFVVAGVCLFLSSMALILARLFNKRKMNES